MDWMVGALAAWVVAMTVLPLVRRDAWWIRACEFPRLQVLALGLLALAGLMLARPAPLPRGLWVGLVAAAVVAQAWRVLPFTPLWRRESAAAGTAGRTFSVLISNVLMTNRESDRFLALVRDRRPDLLLVVEADDWWLRALAPLNAVYPHRVEHPRDDTYGMLLLSQYPLLEREVRFLVDEGVPSIRCVVALGSERLTFHGLHPKPPAPQEAETTTRRDAELLLVAREVADAAGPTVVAGDLNDVAWSYTTRLFRRVSGLLDPRIGRGLFATFPAARPWLRFPLDHVFHSPDLRLAGLRSGPRVGSDHLPIHAEFRLEAGASGAPNGPALEEGDLALAEEKIERGLEDAEE